MNEGLEQRVWNEAERAIYDAIKQRLSNEYNSPLVKLVDAVVVARSDELKALVDELFVAAIRSEQFKAAAREQLAHKVAKALMQKMEGAVDKAANTLRSDPTTRAKIIVAIEKIVADHQPVLA